MIRKIWNFLKKKDIHVEEKDKNNSEPPIPNYEIKVKEVQVKKISIKN
jgi:hypothetical protein